MVRMAVLRTERGAGRIADRGRNGAHRADLGADRYNRAGERCHDLRGLEVLLRGLQIKLRLLQRHEPGAGGARGHVPPVKAAYKFWASSTAPCAIVMSWRVLTISCGEGYSMCVSGCMGFWVLVVVTVNVSRTYSW